MSYKLGFEEYNIKNMSPQQLMKEILKDHSNSFNNLNYLLQITTDNHFDSTIISYSFN